jgi:Na+-transporting methylmalonyl-CoA/oxaloacetate decarboxylase gamma subunit
MEIPIVTGAEALRSALLVTGLGIALIFVAILLLWGLMALIVKIPGELAGSEEEEAGGEEAAVDDVPTLADMPPMAATGEKARAAALAVAVALALQQSRRATTPIAPATSNVSSWQAVLRAGRIGQRAQVFSRKPRG